MASKLKVDELEGVTTAGSIDVTSEGGAVSTNLQQGLAKHWVNFNGTGTIAARDSLNMSSLTDNTTAQYVVANINNMNNANYSIPASTTRYDTIGAVAMCLTPRYLTTSQYEVRCEYNNGSYVDFELIYTSNFGDLA
jgi:hypothetical protein